MLAGYALSLTSLVPFDRETVYDTECLAPNDVGMFTVNHNRSLIVSTVTCSIFYNITEIIQSYTLPQKGCNSMAITL